MDAATAAPAAAAPEPPLVTVSPGAADLYADLFEGGEGEGGTLLRTQVAELSDRVGRQEALIAELRAQVAALTEEVRPPARLPLSCWPADSACS